MALFPVRVAAFGPLAILVVLYVTTAMVTEAMLNNAFALILSLIALSLAASPAVSEFMSQKLESITLHGIVKERWDNGGSP